ncbi:Uncharacterised protein [Mycobacteroides abscessus subsp. abscessus]|nr:Uncharacterised protein [Mycobacteroides abscessus subsp. abscessus]
MEISSSRALRNVVSTMSWAIGRTVWMSSAILLTLASPSSGSFSSKYLSVMIETKLRAASSRSSCTRTNRSSRTSMSMPLLTSTSAPSRTSGFLIA